MAVALPLLLASYQWMVRDSFIGAVLNGQLKRPDSNVAGPTADAAARP
jgi:hypothetical protein